MIFLLGMGLSGCQGPPPLRPEIAMDQSSPRALVETMARAARANDVDAMALCVPPLVQRQWRDILLAKERYHVEVIAFKEALRVQFGSDHVDLLPSEEHTFSFFSFNDDGPTGGLDWSQLVLEHDGSEAVQVLDGAGRALKLTELDGQWYFDPMIEMVPEEGRPYAALVYEAWAAELEELRRRVADGRMNEADVRARFTSD
jgi:hypothetical protein